MAEKLLTIGIPTYNRKESLELCLKALMPQVKLHSEKIRVLVSDNASEVDNYEIIKKYNQEGYEIEYFKHSENLGMDGNFISIFESTTTKYMCQLSDDDIHVENGLSRVIEILIKERDIGVLYVNNIWFPDEIDFSFFNTESKSLYTVYNDPLKYLKKVNYWVTFLSANIVNKELMTEKRILNELNGTFLALLAWNITTCFKGKPNIVLETPILACRAKGQGGYKFVNVFVENFNMILKKLISMGYPKRIKSIMNYFLLKSYFPQFVMAKRNGSIKRVASYLEENWFWAFFRNYWLNRYYYFFLLPAFLFPFKVYNIYYSQIKKLI